MDFRKLKFDDDRATDGAHIKKLLSAAKFGGARPIPVLELDAVPERVEAIRDHINEFDSGLALRFTIDDLDPSKFEELSARVRELFSKSGVSAQSCIAIADFSDADMTEQGALASYLVDSIHELQRIGAWARVIFEGTNFPLKNPAQENSFARVPRLEWQLYSRAREMDRSLDDVATFGDYGADNAVIRGGGGKKVIPHFRYATPQDTLVSRGDGEYSSIRSVAKHILAAGPYMGESFCAGDEFIADCAAGHGGTGNPTDWRRVNMNHHLTLATKEVGDMLGVPLAVPTHRRKARQDVFAGLELTTQGYAK